MMIHRLGDMYHPDVIAEVTAAGDNRGFTRTVTRGGMKMTDKITLQQFIRGCDTYCPVESKDNRVE